MVRPKSKVDMLKPVEALQHQSARNQESHRDRNLRDDEHIKPSAAGRANADSLIALLKTRHHVAFAGAFQRRKQSEDHAGCERYEESKTQCASSKPPTPPSTASNMLSVRSCRTNRHRLAPSARRNANSRARVMPRAS